jgi:hypothetical protein
VARIEGRFFALPLAVTPFLAVPLPRLRAETAFVFGDSELTEDALAPATIFFNPDRDGPVLSPFLAEIQLFRGGIVASNTVFTAARDLRTKRYGQDLVIGILAKPEVYLFHRTIFVHGFTLLFDFLQELVGAAIDQGGGDRLIEQLQTSSTDLDQVLGNITPLLARFEAAFSIKYKEPENWLSRARVNLRIRQFARRKRRQPARDFEQLMTYWQYVDSRLAAGLEPTSEPAAKGFL